jgi:hypothetical protein
MAADDTDSRFRAHNRLIPPFLVERWWRSRKRRQEERLPVLPTDR